MHPLYWNIINSTVQLGWVRLENLKTAGNLVKNTVKSTFSLVKNIINAI